MRSGSCQTYIRFIRFWKLSSMCLSMHDIVSKFFHSLEIRAINTPSLHACVQKLDTLVETLQILGIHSNSLLPIDLPFVIF